MGKFTASDSPRVVGKKYSNRTVLYLESETDLEVFRERWFKNWGEWIEFVAVDTPRDGGGGSAQVHRKVKQDRANKIPAFGIVDRDILFNDTVMKNQPNWPAFFEQDHDTFDAANYVGNGIKILRRWEIENYLLHPLALQEFLEDSDLKNPPCPVQATAQCILDFSDQAILLTAANLTLLGVKQPFLAALFRYNEPQEQLRKSVIAHCEKHGVTQAENQIDNKIAHIRAFLSHETSEPEHRWDSLNHVVDGKIFLERFSKWFGLADSPRLHLARKIKEHQLIDPEIVEFMERLKNADGKLT